MVASRTTAMTSSQSPSISVNMEVVRWDRPESRMTRMASATSGRELVSHAEGRDGNGNKGVHRAAFLFGCKCGFEVCGLSLWDYAADVLVSARGASVTSSVVRL